MELKLEDYAKRENRIWYEIMREYADGLHMEKGPAMFLRPSSGYLVVWHFTLKEDEKDKTYNGFEKTQSLRGMDCSVPAAIWMDWALNAEPPWNVPANPENGPMEIYCYSKNQNWLL